MEVKNRPKRTAVLLAALLIVAVGAGAYFLLTPGMERGKAQAQQDALLESITQGDGVIIVPVQLADLDYYDPPADDAEQTPDVIPAEIIPLAVPAAETAGTDEDNGAITGLGVLTIEKIDLKLPISEGIGEAQLKISPGHVPQTPPIGETGNAVVAGHRSYEYGKHFNRLGELENGDLIQYQSKDGETMTFAVFDILEVNPGDQTAFEQPEDTKILTLYTCTPIKKATHRLIIRAERIY